MLTHYVQYGILKLTPSTCSDRSRVPDKRRVPDTGRGSRQIVLIEAGGFYPGIYGTYRNVQDLFFQYSKSMSHFLVYQLPHQNFFVSCNRGMSIIDGLCGRTKYFRVLLFWENAFKVLLMKHLSIYIVYFSSTNEKFIQTDAF